MRSWRLVDDLAPGARIAESDAALEGNEDRTVIASIDGAAIDSRSTRRPDRLPAKRDSIDIDQGAALDTIAPAELQQVITESLTAPGRGSRPRGALQSTNHRPS